MEGTAIPNISKFKSYTCLFLHAAPQHPKNVKSTRKPNSETADMSRMNQMVGFSRF